MNERAITLDPVAAQKVAEFITRAPNVTEATCLRIGVRGGGCSGYQYVLAFDDQREGDLLFESEGQRIIAEADALKLIGGSRIVWKEVGLSGGFDVENPNATASCGCGSSFRVDKEEAADCTGRSPSDA